MKILAFDISASPGVAVVDIKRGKPKLILADSVKTDNKTTDAQRFAYVEAFAVKAIHEYGPFDVIVREHFVRGGSGTTLKMVYLNNRNFIGIDCSYEYVKLAQKRLEEVK